MEKRPVDLALARYKFPPMALVSICHRISGVLIFLFLPLMLFWLAKSLASAASFAMLMSSFNHIGMKVLLWVILASILFHLVAGIRHLLMDLGFGESLTAGKISAYIVFAVFAILAIMMGVWLW